MPRRPVLPVLVAAGLVIPAAVGLAGPVLAAEPPPVCAAGECTVTYGLTGTPDTFTVPAGVASITVTVAGGSGGLGHEDLVNGLPARAGGDGGSVVATVPVTPGATLTVVVGGQGADADNVGGVGAAGGYGGGGSTPDVGGGSDGAGGGGSFLFDGASVLVASGGGGGGGYQAGGDGGAGGAAEDGADGGPTGVGGGGATTTAPGAGGVGADESGTDGTGPASGPDTFGTGGGGSATCASGGGGGGFYGGGSGGCDTTDTFMLGGGGGGSGVLGAGVVATSRTTNTGDGRVVIRYALPATTTTLSVSPTSAQVGTDATLSATVSGPSGSPTPTGTVTFREGSTVLGAGTLANGVAGLTVPAGSTAGQRTFTADYGGSDVFSASTSDDAVLTVTAAPTPTPTPTPGGGPAATPTPVAAAGLLAQTGPQGLGVLVTLGCLGIALGGVLLVAARRRVPGHHLR